MSGTQFPAVLAGQALTAALIQAFSPWAAVKSADTSRASNTTLAVDPDLTFGIPSAGTYELDGYLNYEGSTGPGDLQIEFSSVGTLRYMVIGDNTAGALGFGATNVGGGVVTLGCTGAGNLRAAQIIGTIITPAAGGITLNWAQATTSATPTIMHAGSRLRLRRIA